MFKIECADPMIPSSRRRSVNHKISCTAGVAPTYSASVEERATIDWSLLLQQIAPPPIIHTKPDVDRRVSTHPAQSESEKPSMKPSIGFIATPREYPVTSPGGDASEEYRMA